MNYFSYEKVQAIVVSIQKALKSMMLIFFVLIILMIIFGLLIFTLFQDTGEENGIQYTFEKFEEMFKSPGKQDLEVRNEKRENLF